MFTGYNDNVESSGKHFHVQTEDKGLSNPIVETLVYSGGQVVASVQSSYADLADSPDYSQPQIQRRMQLQHQQLIEEIQRGEFKAERARPKRLSPAATEQHASVGLVAEYVDDWIDGAASTEPIRKALELEIDRADASPSEEPAHAGKKKSPLAAAALVTALLVAAGSFLLWFDGRTSSPAQVKLPQRQQTTPQPAKSDLVEAQATPAPVATPEPIEMSPDLIAPAAPVLPPKREIRPIPQRARRQEVPMNGTVPLEPLQEAPTPVRLLAAASVASPLGEIIPPPPIKERKAEVPQRRDFEVGEVDQPPVSLSTQLPVYTETALRHQREGSSRMVVLVGEDGAIDAVRMIDEIADAELNRAAVSAVMYWKFEPAIHDGKPVRVWLPIELSFSLSGNGMRSVVTISEE